jgi:hypothetical protein
VIRNPEVSGLVPHLLAAIADPNGSTRPALDVLLETVFVNTIDAASLVSEWEVGTRHLCLRPRHPWCAVKGVVCTALQKHW